MVLGILITAILAALILLVSRFFYKLAFYNINTTEEDVYTIPLGKQYETVSDVILENVRQLQQLPYEQIYITASDGERLAARYYHFKDNAPVQILFHGYRGSGIREYACGNQIARALGYNTIVVDERAHGKSGGHTITFGIQERWDCVDWAEYARIRFGRNTQLILSGVSMGAATVLMASELDLPETVAAITADCPYSSPGKIIRKVAKDVKIPPWLIYPFVTLGALLFGHFCLWKSSPLKAVANTDIPILLIHGADDRFVPMEMSQQIFAACNSKKQLEIFEGAGHGMSYLIDEKRYLRIYQKFFQECGIRV